MFATEDIILHNISIIIDKQNMYVGKYISHDE